MGGWAVVAAGHLGENPTAVESPLTGEPAPAFTLPALGGGREVASAGFQGRVWVVNFWASWCVPCREEAPYLESFYRRHADEGVGMVGIVYNDVEDEALAFREELGLTYPQVMDPRGRTASDFGVFGVPETFVVDERGVVMASLIGAIGPDSLDDVLASIRRGEPVSRGYDKYASEPG